MKKFTAILLIFSLIALSANLYAKERRGAKLIVTKKDGLMIEGELIAVKPNSLLLMNAEESDVSIGIGEIKVVKIVKKSKLLLGAGSGLLVGGGIGALVGLVAYKPQGWMDLRGVNTFVYITAGGTLSGAIFGAVAGIDETIQIEDRPPASIEFYLDKLRKKARVRDYK